MSENLLEVIRHRYTDHLNAPCLTYPDDGQWTYGEIDRLSGQFAAALLNAGICADDRIIVQIEKSAAAVALYLACLQIGAIYIPINPACTDKELALFLTDAKPRLLICRPEDIAVLKPLAENHDVKLTMCLGNNPDSALWADVQKLEPHTEIQTRTAQDTAAILYTSGTTGRSKGAMISHHNLSGNAMSLHKIWGFEPGDVLLHALPIFHIHGLFVALHCALLNASEILFLPRFNVDAVRKTLRRATVMMGVPTFYTRLLEKHDFGSQDCRNMRLFISGSAPMTEITHQKFEQRTGHRILERYGMTEAGMITSNPLHGERLAGTVGYPLPGIKLRISDDGKVLPAGETGMIEIKGPNVFQGYWQLPEATRQNFTADGFFITGDLGKLENDGRLSITGRARDLIISGGYNVYPGEIENSLDNLPEVIESAVIGLPHPDLGEAVTAIVVIPDGTQPDENELISLLAGQLAGYKQPKRIFFSDELPRNTMGKVQKNILREQYKNTYVD